ncbi:MAG: hypothetical protein J5700_06120, partial [Treponema sp.]|nr:hypothetical protein [Treponema sp.]
MAKRKSAKAKTPTRTKVITKTKRVFVKANRDGRRIRRAAGEKMGTMDIVLAVGGAGVGSIGGSILLSKMPESIPDVAKNGVLSALGGFVAYKGLKKKNRLLLGLGLGAAAAGATNIISGLIPSGSTVSGYELAAPYAQLNAPYSGLNGSECLAAPLGSVYDGEEM